MEKECKACGIIFETNNMLKIYCDECGKNGRGIQKKIVYDNASKRNHRIYDEPTIYTIHCETCGKPFTGPTRVLYKTYRVIRQKDNHRKNVCLCSQECEDKYKKANTLCWHCGKHTYSLSNFCSDECKTQYEYNEAQKKGWVRYCEHCGKQFIRSTGWFCSQECSRAARKAGWKRPE